MIRVQQKIYIGLFVLQYFTTRKWNFDWSRYGAIYKGLTPDEKIMFDMETEKIDTAIYMKKLLMGGRVYCMKEPLSSLPKARIQMKM